MAGAVPAVVVEVDNLGRRCRSRSRCKSRRWCMKCGPTVHLTPT